MGKVAGRAWVRTQIGSVSLEVPLERALLPNGLCRRAKREDFGVGVLRRRSVREMDAPGAHNREVLAQIQAQPNVGHTCRQDRPRLELANKELEIVRVPAGRQIVGVHVTSPLHSHRSSVELGVDRRHDVGLGGVNVGGEPPDAREIARGEISERGRVAVVRQIEWIGTLGGVSDWGKGCTVDHRRGLRADGERVRGWCHPVQTALRPRRHVQPEVCERCIGSRVSESSEPETKRGVKAN